MFVALQRKQLYCELLRDWGGRWKFSQAKLLEQGASQDGQHETQVSKLSFGYLTS